jgi:hypothetical protein
MSGVLKFDPLDMRFISLWIAFNALYGQRRAHDWPDIETFLERLLKSDADRVREDLLDMHAESIALLGLEFLYFEYWASGFTDDMAETITRNVLQAEFNWAERTPEKSLLSLFERLYILRNQVFHGSAKYGSSKNRDSIRPSVTLLERLVETFTKIVAADERSARWGPPPNVPKGSMGHPRDKRSRLNPLHSALRRGRSVNHGTRPPSR